MSEESTSDTDVNAAVQANAQQEDWRSSLPEDLRGAKSLEGVADVNSLAKQFVDLQAHLGTSIRIPGEDAGEDAIKAFHEKIMSKTNLMLKPETEDDVGAIMRSLGAPDEASGYELPDSDIDYSNLQSIAHKAGLTKKQFESIISDVSAHDAESMELSQAELVESRKAVEKEWGNAFDRNSKEAIALLEVTKAPASVIQQAKDGKINGEALSWFYSLASRLGAGEGVNASGDEGGSLVMTPAEAQAQLDEVMNNPIYSDVGHSRHKEFQDKAMRLRNIRSGRAA
jgi:hypothetical protein